MTRRDRCYLTGKRAATLTEAQSALACECGFPVMKDAIKVGAEYRVNPDIAIDAELTCGGCGKVHHITAIAVQPAGFLPKKLFFADNSDEIALHA